MPSQDSEKIKTVDNESPSSNAISQLGYIGLHEVDGSTPFIDIKVDAIDSPHFAPAVARPYEGIAKRGLIIDGSPSQFAQAASYAASVFPESSFTHLGDGRYGIVLADNTGKAYKVYRNALHYSRYEKEAGALRLLSDAGLAPRLHLFVDADQQYRLDRKAYDYTTFGFEDVQIPRQNSGKELPVMIMDKIEVESLENAEPSKLIDGFCKAAVVFIKENIISWDTQVMVDKATGNIIIIDVGELFQVPFDRSSATLQAQASHDLKILHMLAIEFGLSKSSQQIQAAYQQGGINEIRSSLTKLLVTT